ncbi:Parvalbumin [Trema orientale]|uniref:Parvalbumin n=1 Tax=Trema orientale TaxID=63057 RepID=A0A2P5E778_TREOI|nr:Parvalbumin [Trema orientale]
MAKKSSASSEPSSLGTMDDVRKVFNKFDSNGDGRISCDELRGMLLALGSKTSTEEVKRIMAEIDKDGDGYIDLKEFAEFHSGSEADQCGGAGAAAGAGNKELKDAFDLYDLDKNGLISASELHAVMKRLGEKCSLSDCSRMIRSVDADGDGSVNFEEFKKMMTRG